MGQNSELRALWVQVRQPAIRVALGAALMGPAALMAGNRYDTVAQQRVLAEQAVVAHERQLAQQRLEEETERLEREQQFQVASLAREFRIPVTLAAEIHEAAVEEQIAPRMAFGLVRAESSFRAKVVSPVGAVGLTQLLPSTARWLEPGTTRTDLMTPETNLRIGFKYLRHLIDRFGNAELALTAYNRGPGTVSKLLKRGKNPDNGYAEKVLTGRSDRHVRLMNAKFGTRS